MTPMEKGVPHYKLSAIKSVVLAQGDQAFTKVAVRGVGGLALSMEEAIRVVLALERIHFYKSMTTHADHRVWQDVYQSPCPNGRMAYIKLTLRDDGVVVIQFKEL
jgi:motility quorum-sensing regulator/GCU-specific mRNA interferase toxin